MINEIKHFHTGWWLAVYTSSVPQDNFIWVHNLMLCWQMQHTFAQSSNLLQHNAIQNDEHSLFINNVTNFPNASLTQYTIVHKLNHTVKCQLICIIICCRWTPKFRSG